MESEVLNLPVTVRTVQVTVLTAHGNTQQWIYCSKADIVEL